MHQLLRTSRIHANRQEHASRLWVTDGECRAEAGEGFKGVGCFHAQQIARRVSNFD